MSETVNGNEKPAVVIITAVLNFIGAAIAGLVLVASVVGLLYGAGAGIFSTITSRMSQLYPSINASYGVSFLLGFLIAFSGAFTFFYAMLALSLLKGRKWAWYAQVCLSVMGLVGFPIWTVVNGLILYYYFRPATRGYFKV